MSKLDPRSLLVLAFDSPLQSREAFLAFQRLQHDEIVVVHDAVFIEKDESGKTRVTETVDLEPGESAAEGGLWGALLGTLVAGPLGLLVGGATSAGLGALAAKLIDLGIPDATVRELEQAIAPEPRRSRCCSATCARTASSASSCASRGPSWSQRSHGGDGAAPARRACWHRRRVVITARAISARQRVAARTTGVHGSSSLDQSTGMRTVTPTPPSAEHRASAHRSVLAVLLFAALPLGACGEDRPPAAGATAQAERASDQLKDASAATHAHDPAAPGGPGGMPGAAAPQAGAVPATQGQGQGSMGGMPMQGDAMPPPGTGGAMPMQDDAMPPPGGGGAMPMQDDAMPPPTGGAMPMQDDAMPPPSTGGSMPMAGSSPSGTAMAPMQDDDAMEMGAMAGSAAMGSSGPMGMGMMGMCCGGMGGGMAGGAGAGSGMAGMGGAADPKGGAPTGMTGAMGTSGKSRMGGKAGTKAATLPGFPGQQHLYHVGAVDFFLDRATELALTPAQTSELARRKTDALAASKATQAELIAAEQRLWALTGSDRPDAAKIEGTLGQLERLRATQRLALIRAVADAATLLDEAQRECLSAWADDATGLIEPTTPAPSTCPGVGS